MAQVLEKAFGLEKGNKGRTGKVFSWFIVFLFCNLAWVFFRADSFSDAVYVIQHALPVSESFKSYAQINMGPDKRSLRYIFTVIALVAAYDFITLKQDIIDTLKNKKILGLVFEYALVILIIIALINGTGSNQFVYFQF